MSIVSLFCEIDDFFLEYETWKATQCLPEPTPLETRGCPRKLHPSADKGYISEDVREALREQGVNLVYKVRKNMDPLDLSVSDEVLLKKRMLIESVIRELKTQMQLEHTRQRSVDNFQVHVFSALIAYQLLENKPTLNLTELLGVSDLPIIVNE